MPDFIDRCDNSWTSFGHRRGISDTTRLGLDLTRAKLSAFGGAAGPGSYPSPPMSGSPPLPPRISHEVAERNQGAHQPTAHDVHRGGVATQGEDAPQIGSSSISRPFLSETPERRPSYALPPLEPPAPGPLPYPRQLGPTTIPQPSYPPPILRSGAPATQIGPLPVPQPYSVAPLHQVLQPPGSIQDGQSRPQRKTKGHVASACVPCKKAHLRCDEHRPCTRCQSTNKEAACVDVQHKKRGRPRLRDDSSPKYDGSKFGQAADALRRPLTSALAPGPSMGTPPSDPLRRIQSYRVLKSQSADPARPRFPEHVLAAASINATQLPLTTARAPHAQSPDRRMLEEPVAFLTIGLDFSRASTMFLKSIGRLSVAGLSLGRVLVPEEQAKATKLHQQAQQEQTKKDPAYLPPIFGDRSRVVLQALGFSSEELSRYVLPWTDVFTFLSDNGQRRQYPVRMGLASKESIYFVVLLLDRESQPLYPTPSPGIREGLGSYESPLQPYAHPTPRSVTFSSSLAAGYEPRQPGPLNAPLQTIVPGRSPGFPPTSYTASPSRPDYPHATSSYQTLRSELPLAVDRQVQSSDFPMLSPLPPIRSPPVINPQQLSRAPAPPTSRSEARDERSRIGINGLLDNHGPAKDAS